jgi:hypothetical protein
MSQPSLEDRVATLEKQVAVLLRDRTASGRTKDFRRTRGAFTGDDLMKQIFEEGRKIREAERRQARRKGSRKARS